MYVKNYCVFDSTMLSTYADANGGTNPSGDLRDWAVLVQGFNFNRRTLFPMSGEKILMVCLNWQGCLRVLTEMGKF